jgi:hypothetical protein
MLAFAGVSKRLAMQRRMTRIFAEELEGFSSEFFDIVSKPAQLLLECDGSDIRRGRLIR